MWVTQFISIRMRLKIVNIRIWWMQSIVQVLCHGCGSHPLLWNICTDCKSKKFDPPKIVPSCFCAVILVSFFLPSKSTAFGCMPVYTKMGILLGPIPSTDCDMYTVVAYLTIWQFPLQFVIFTPFLISTQAFPLLLHGFFFSICFLLANGRKVERFYG